MFPGFATTRAVFHRYLYFVGVSKVMEGYGKNESHGVIFNGFCGTKAISLEKTALRVFFCVADVFVSAAFAAKYHQRIINA